MTEQNEIIEEKEHIDRVKDLQTELEHAFFRSSDLKAAAGIGLYFRIIAYRQTNILGSRTLIKNTRIWFKEFNKTNLLLIFEDCIKIQFKIMDKERRNYLYLTDLRKQIERFLKEDNWVSATEELSLAFMIGYDSYKFYNRSENKDKKE